MNQFSRSCIWDIILKGPCKNNTTAFTNPVARKHDLGETTEEFFIAKKVLQDFWADVNITERNAVSECTYIFV